METFRKYLKEAIDPKIEYKKAIDIFYKAFQSLEKEQRSWNQKAMALKSKDKRLALKSMSKERDDIWDKFFELRDSIEKHQKSI